MSASTVDPRVYPGLAPAPTGRLGMWVFLVTDAMSFAALLIAYGVLRAQAPSWPAAGARLDVPLAALATFLLLGSSLTMALAADAAAAARAGACRRWMGATVALGLGFLGAAVWEWAALARHGIGFAFDHAASTFFVLTGWHGAHVAIGIGYLVAVMIAGRAGGSTARVATAALFWQFLDAVWILLFTFLYLV